MIKEGSIVVVTGRLDERVRENTESVIVGTVVQIKGGKISVLLKDGNIWMGNDWEVYEIQGDADVRLSDLREEHN